MNNKAKGFVTVLSLLALVSITWSNDLKDRFSIGATAGMAYSIQGLKVNYSVNRILATDIRLGIMPFERINDDPFSSFGVALSAKALLQLGSVYALLPTLSAGATLPLPYPQDHETVYWGPNLEFRVNVFRNFYLDYELGISSVYAKGFERIGDEVPWFHWWTPHTGAGFGFYLGSGVENSWKKPGRIVNGLLFGILSTTLAVSYTALLVIFSTWD